MKKIVIIALTALCLIMMPQASWADQEIVRIQGSNRYQTAIAISQELYSHVDVVVIASGHDFPDGLTGGILSRVVDGPLLLTPQKQITPEILSEIKRLSPTQIYLLGGENTISKGIEDTLKKMAITTRLAGKNRYETALKVADEIQQLSGKKIVGITSGQGFADALSAAALLAREEAPLLLTEKSGLTENTKKFIQREGFESALIFGGQESIPNKILDSLTIPTSRFSGQTRYETAFQIATQGFVASKTVVLVNGIQFPDALAAAPLAVKRFAPILLTPSQQTPIDVLKVCAESDKIIIIGGEESVGGNLEKELVQFKKASVHKLIDVIDGDTLLITFYGREERVKLIGVAPLDRNLVDQDAKTKKWLYKQLKDKEITLSFDVVQRNQDGDLLAYVFYSDGNKDTMVNLKMIEEGLASVVRKDSNIKYQSKFLEAEENAKEKHLGLWDKN